MNEIKLKEDTVIKLALAGRRPIPVAETDDWGDLPLWVWRDECGIRAIVAAKSFESAYYAMIEVMPRVSDGELHEAYGFDTRDEFEQAMRDARDGSGDYPELCEGYAHTDNGEVVHTSPYGESIDPLTTENIDELDITLRIGRSDSPDYVYARVGGGQMFSDFVTRGDLVCVGDGPGRHLYRVLAHVRKCGDIDPTSLLCVSMHHGDLRVLPCADLRTVDADRLMGRLTADMDDLAADLNTRTYVDHVQRALREDFQEFRAE